MKYKGFVGKLPIVAALLINVVTYPSYGMPTLFDAIMNAVVAYMLCRWIIVPIFGKRVYTETCKECGTKYEYEANSYDRGFCRVCDTISLQHSIMQAQAATIQEEKRKRVFLDQTTNEIKGGNNQTQTETVGNLFCRHCGTEVKIGNFCSACGGQL